MPTMFTRHLGYSRRRWAQEVQFMLIGAPQQSSKTLRVTARSTSLRLLNSI